MKEQLIQYVNLLFAGNPDCEDVKQEILQNTLDRYDDLISQGKSPQAAYQLAITGIGDISEIIGNPSEAAPHNQFRQAIAEESDTIHRRILRAVAVALYIISPIPLFVLGEMGSNFMDTIGLCGMLAIIAVATVMMMLGKKKTGNTMRHEDIPLTPRQELHKSVDSVIWAIGLAVYFILSFVTQAWHLTWIVFLIIKCVQGLARAIIDLKETVEHEN